MARAGGASVRGRAAGMKRWLILLAALPLFASAAAERVISLGGDVTEIVYALNAGQQLVAKDSTSTPAAAHKLPDVGYLRQLNAEGSSPYARSWCWPARRRSRRWCCRKCRTAR